MSYLYGDSSPSPLTSNFLEFLRAAIDFSVHVLQSDEKIRQTRAHVEETEHHANVTRDYLAQLGERSKKATQGYIAEVGEPLVQNCGQTILARIDDSVQSGLASLQASLDAEWEKHRAWVNEERASCRVALGAMLLKGEPPETEKYVQVECADGKGYSLRAWATSRWGFSWESELQPPAGHPLAELARVEKFLATFEVSVPAMVSGWLKKELKVKPTRLEKYFVMGLGRADGGAWLLRLRDQPHAVEGKNPTGWDFEIGKEGEVSAKWIGEADATPYTLSDDDAGKFAELVSSIHRSADELSAHGKESYAASFDGTSFEKHDRQLEAVERLMEKMAPIVREIATHSLTPTEFVLRRLLGNDRREEIFVTRASLLEKILQMPIHLRRVFDPLELEAMRFSLAPEGRRSQAPQAVTALPRGSERPAAAPEPATPSRSGVVSVHPSEETSARDQSSLSASIKAIIRMTKAGNTDEAYAAWASLFSGEIFASAKPEDQRQALKLMVHAKNRPAMSIGVGAAYERALEALTLLTTHSNEPGDYEMMGICQLLLDRSEAANTTFRTAIELEKERNPNSSMIDVLEKRASGM